MKRLRNPIRLATQMSRSHRQMAMQEFILMLHFNWAIWAPLQNRTEYEYCFLLFLDHYQFLNLENLQIKVDWLKPQDGVHCSKLRVLDQRKALITS